MRPSQIPSPLCAGWGTQPGYLGPCQGCQEEAEGWEAPWATKVHQGPGQCGLFGGLELEPEGAGSPGLELRFLVGHLFWRWMGEGCKLHAFGLSTN